jgi:DNA-binding response OmpR family regulator
MKNSRKELNVLIVEDNPGDFALVEDFLLTQVEVISLVHAESYREAAEAIKGSDTTFDVVLLDLSLPDKTGIPLIKEMVELCSATPVIVLTGYADLAFGVKSLALGISDYILKEELNPTFLYKSILYSIERKKSVAALAIQMAEKLNYIKAVELQNEKLRDISWMQSHVVRAPLARIMGLTQLFKDSASDEDRENILEYLMLSANELDKAIGDIIKKAVIASDKNEAKGEKAFH